MSINIKTQKILSPSNVKKIIELGISLKDNLDVVNQKCVEEYDDTRTYAPNMLCIYNNYIWECKFTTTGVFNENKWDKLSDDLSLIDLDAIKNMVNLTDEEITNLQSLISTEIRLDKVFSSSDVYNRILNAENECKKFTLEQLAKKAGVVYKIVDDTTGVDSTEYLYLIPNGSNGYNIYAYIDGSAVKISDTNINLDGYAKLTDLDDYVKKTDATATYATITTVDGKVDKTSILSTISSTPSDDNLLSEKAINDTLVKKTDITTTIDSSSTDIQVPSAKSVFDSLYELCDTQVLVDANKPTSKMCMADLTTLNTPAKQGMTDAQASLIISAYGNATWNGQISITTAEPSVYVRSVRDVAGNWTKWRKLCSTSVADVGLTNIVFTNSNVEKRGAENCVYCVKNGICHVTLDGLIFKSGYNKQTEFALLPKPVVRCSCLLTNDLGDIMLGRLYVQTDGSVHLYSDKLPFSEIGYCSFSYPVKESE